MIRISILLAVFFGALSLQAQENSDGTIHRLPGEEASKTISLNPEYHVFGESMAKGKGKFPLLIFLHGGGATGLDINRIKGSLMRLLRTLGEAGIETLLVAPQAAHSPMKVGAKGGWIASDLNILLKHLLKTLPVEPDRVYLTGVSMGGYGTYFWAGTHPEHFAAIAPMVGGLGALGPKDITSDLDRWGANLAKLPMKAYYGAQDRVVPADRGEMIMKAVKKAGGRKAELNVYEDMGHNAAQRPYSDPEFFRWLFSHRRGD